MALVNCNAAGLPTVLVAGDVLTVNFYDGSCCNLGSAAKNAASVLSFALPPAGVTNVTNICMLQGMSPQNFVPNRNLYSQCGSLLFSWNSVTGNLTISQFGAPCGQGGANANTICGGLPVASMVIPTSSVDAECAAFNNPSAPFSVRVSLPGQAEGLSTASCLPVPSQPLPTWAIGAIVGGSVALVLLVMFLMAAYDNGWCCKHKSGEESSLVTTPVDVTPVDTAPIGLNNDNNAIEMN